MARIVAKIPERTSITRGGGTVARWNSSESFRSHYLARVGTSTAAFVVETALSDAGAVVLEPPPTFTAPSITSEPPTGAHVGELVEYTPSTDAQGLVWWSLQGAPKDARIDPKTGTITWTPTEEVEVSFILELRTEATAVEQRIEISVPPRPDMGTDDTATGSSGAATESSGASSPGLSGGDGTSNAEEIVDSCACTNGSDRSLGWLFSWFGLVALARRRKRERA
jgi:MYXO-CTERM domain-containing protein